MKTVLANEKGDDKAMKRDELNVLERAARTSEFWRRTMGIYVGYKVTQLRVRLIKARDRVSADSPRISKIWEQQHVKAGKEMYNLCVDLKGFYIKTGQFLGSRGEFVPVPLCMELAALQDKVPPMPAAQVRRILEKELRPRSIEDVFEDIDLEHPLGSASIAQVHKARLKGRGGGGDERRLAARECACKDVAVKIQFPDVEKKMHADFKNLRMLSSFLQRTELQFDLVSATDELQKQVSMEFDFRREAAVMDHIAENLKMIAQ